MYVSRVLSHPAMHSSFHTHPHYMHNPSMHTHTSTPRSFNHLLAKQNGALALVVPSRVTPPPRSPLYKHPPIHKSPCALLALQTPSTHLFTRSFHTLDSYTPFQSMHTPTPRLHTPCRPLPTPHSHPRFKSISTVPYNLATRRVTPAPIHIPISHIHSAIHVYSTFWPCTAALHTHAHPQPRPIRRCCA